MDRHNIIGFALIFVVLMLWSYFNSKQQQQQLSEKRIQDSITWVQRQDDSLRNLIRSGNKAIPSGMDSVEAPVKALVQGPFVPDSQAVAKDMVIENEVLKLTLNSLGGQIIRAELKNYKKMVEVAKGPDETKPLYLLQHPSNSWDFNFPIGDQKVHTRDILFSISDVDPDAVTFKTNAADKQLELRYSLRPNSYTVDLSLGLSGLKTETVQLDWQNFIEPQERAVKYEASQTAIHYKPVQDDKEKINAAGSEKESFEGQVAWVSHAQQFFNTTVIADLPFKNMTIETTPGPEGAEYTSKLNTTVSIPFQGMDVQHLKLYIGPNEFKTLQAHQNGMEDIISFGASILGTINKWVIRPVFNFLSDFIGSKGIVILVLTFIVKLILFPLSYKMLHSQAKMGALKPEMNLLKDRLKGDQQAIQMESMKLYREFGVNPLGGCLPMLLQMPIWLALYQFFPASIEFRQAGFLWADDLSSYDVFAKLPFVIPFFGAHVSLFTLIWVVSTLVFTYYSTKDQDFSMNPAMKYMQYIMPLFFLFFFNNSASGLTAYMAFSNVLNIGQTVGGKALFFPLEKMKLELQASRNKPKKKGGFQDRLETMMKEQQKKLDEKQKPVKK